MSETNHNKPTLTEADLAHFTGTENHYRNQLGLLYTDGVQFMAERGGAYWLIDAIASYQRDKRIIGNQRLQEFQLWELKVEKSRAVLTVREDSGDRYKPVITQEIEYTDFPLAEIKLYVCDGVLLLPSEY